MSQINLLIQSMNERNKIDRPSDGRAEREADGRQRHFQYYSHARAFADPF